jgi:hypothetical protein
MEISIEVMGYKERNQSFIHHDKNAGQLQHSKYPAGQTSLSQEWLEPLTL